MSARSAKACRTITRSAITQPHRRATDTPIAAKPGAVIFAMGILADPLALPEQSRYQGYASLLSNRYEENTVHRRIHLGRKCRELPRGVPQWHPMQVNLRPWHTAQVVL